MNSQDARRRSGKGKQHGIQLLSLWQERRSASAVAVSEATAAAATAGDQGSASEAAQSSVSKIERRAREEGRQGRNGEREDDGSERPDDDERTGKGGHKKE